MIPRFRGILFDKDGTLLDFEATWAPLFRALTLELADGRSIVLLPGRDRVELASVINMLKRALGL